MNEVKNQKDNRIWKRVGIAIGIIVFLLFVQSLMGETLLEQGTEAPSFHLRMANGSGQTLALDDLRGKVVLLDFWSTTCAPCLAEISILQGLRSRYADQGLEVVGISVGGESLDRIRSFAGRKGIAYPMVVDGNGVLSHGYRVRSLPTLYVLNRKGQVFQSHVGFWPADELAAVVQQALAETD